MRKRMSFKRMIRSSCRVEPCSTRHEIDLPMKNFKKQTPREYVFYWQKSALKIERYFYYLSILSAGFSSPSVFNPPFFFISISNT
ncbi:hypothetical protein AHAS_Ahas03G0212200 [Arachis hypogaea]